MQHIYSTHPSIRNKPAHWSKSFACDWQRTTGDLESLRTHVANGGAFIPAAMSSSHRSGDVFQSATIAVIDIDDVLSIEECLKHPLVQHAAWIYTTSRHDIGHRLWNYDTGERLGIWLTLEEAQQALAAHRQQDRDSDFKILSSDRFRIVFQLPEIVTIPDLYRQIIQYLTTQLGGDKSTTNPCNIFYGNDQAEHPLWEPQRVLPYHYIQKAQDDYSAQQRQRQEASDEIDDTTIARATYVLENVLEPTSDGQRDLFIRITAAASSAGETLFPAWSDWASRGHHGSGRNARQASERFFNGFKGRSSIGTLFFLATQQDPGWRDRLPADIRVSDGYRATASRPPGYGHEDFYGDMQQFLEDGPPAASATISLFSDDAAQTWSRKPTATQPSRSDTAPSTDDDQGQQGGESDSPPPDDGTPAPPAKKKPAEDSIGIIKDRLLALYPGLRLNTLTQAIEHGSLEKPDRVNRLDTAYIRISRGQKDVYPKTTVYDTAQVIAWENRYNPVSKYLQHCLDNVKPAENFDRLATDLLGLSDDPTLNPTMSSGENLADLIMKRFLVGAVDRVLNPGCVHDWMVILVGPQNLGKSAFFRYLTPCDPSNPGIYPWSCTIQQGLGYLKERPHVLHAGWIVVLDEIERYFVKRYQEEFKNLVSTPVDRSRRLYENESDFPRSFVLAGNANSMDFMVDPSGNRRYMPICVRGTVQSSQSPGSRIIDLDRLKLERDAIWAAAHRSYLDNPVHTFSSAETQETDDFVQSFARDSAYEHQVATLVQRRNSGIYRGEPYIIISDLLSWMEIPVECFPRAEQEVAQALKRLNYYPKRARIGLKHQTRIWLKTSD
jgi:hypothetical protein